MTSSDYTDYGPEVERAAPASACVVRAAHDD